MTCVHVHRISSAFTRRDSTRLDPIAVLYTNNMRSNNDFFFFFFDFTASLTILMSSFWTIYISPVLLKFKKNEIDFAITVTEKTWIVSIMDFGNLLSPIVAGKAMDKYGRKRTLVFSAFIYVVSSIFVLCASSARELFIARLLAGIAKGFAFTVTPIYVAEISSKNIRGTLSSYFYGFFCIGTVVATAIGPYVSFQTYNIISLMLPLFFLVMTVPMPESPYFYVMNNQHEKAKKALKWYRDTSTKQKQVSVSQYSCVLRYT